MHNPKPKLGLFRLIFCMRGKLFFLVAVDILSTFVAAPCSRTIRNITCLTNSVQHGIKSRRYPVFVESSRVVFLGNRTPVVYLLFRPSEPGKLSNQLEVQRLWPTEVSRGNNGLRIFVYLNFYHTSRIARNNILTTGQQQPRTTKLFFTSASRSHLRAWFSHLVQAPNPLVQRFENSKINLLTRKTIFLLKFVS